MYNLTDAQKLVVYNNTSQGEWGSNYHDLSEQRQEDARMFAQSWIDDLQNGRADWWEDLGPEPAEWRVLRDAHLMERELARIQRQRERLNRAALDTLLAAAPRRRDEWATMTNTFDLPDEAAGTPQRVEEPLTIPRRKTAPVPTATTTVNEFWNIRVPEQVPRKYREGMLLSLPPAQFPYDHCVGLEIEVEQPRFREDSPEWKTVQEAFKVARDGSLRNGGLEFITKYGVTVGDALSYLPVMDKLLSERQFSFRCGLHVHVDVTTLTLEELYRVFLIYSVMENVLFYVSGGRNLMNSVKFCVGVQSSQNSVTNAIHYGQNRDWKGFTEAVTAGTKYMAMNVKAVRRYGTLEFRHHEGTCEGSKVERWCLALFDLVAGAKNRNTERLESQILELNTDSQYLSFLREYFPNSFEFLKDVPEFERMMYPGVTYVKSAFVGEPEMLSLREID